MRVKNITVTVSVRVSVTVVFDVFSSFSATRPNLFSEHSKFQVEFAPDGRSKLSIAFQVMNMQHMPRPTKRHQERINTSFRTTRLMTTYMFRENEHPTIFPVFALMTP